MSDQDDLGLDPAFVDRLAALVSDLQPADFERHDPPENIWRDIGPSARPDSTSVGAGTVVEYTIDGNDVVVSVGGGWADFAVDNGAPELAEPGPARTLWSHIEGDEVRNLWIHVVDRVRATGQAAQVPLRCDAPDMRRWFDMTVTPGPDRRVHFRSVLVFEEPRRSLPLLASSASAGGTTPAVLACSLCGDAHDGSAWRRIDEVVRELRLLEEQTPSVRYGVCPACHELMAGEILLDGRHRGPRRR